MSRLRCLGEAAALTLQILHSSKNHLLAVASCVRTLERVGEQTLLVRVCIDHYSCRALSAPLENDRHPSRASSCSPSALHSAHHWDTCRPPVPPFSRPSNGPCTLPRPCECTALDWRNPLLPAQGSLCCCLHASCHVRADLHMDQMNVLPTIA